MEKRMKRTLLLMGSWIPGGESISPQKREERVKKGWISAYTILLLLRLGLDSDPDHQLSPDFFVVPARLREIQLQLHRPVSVHVFFAPHSKMQDVLFVVCISKDSRENKFSKSCIRKCLKAKKGTKAAYKGHA